VSAVPTIRRLASEADGAAVLEIDGLTFGDCRRTPAEIVGLNSADYPVFLAFQGARAVGYLCLMRVRTLHYDAYWVDLVAVRPDSQGQGVGKAMIAFGAAYAKTQGAEFTSALVRRGNGPSRAAFLHQGFTAVPEGFDLMVLNTASES